MTKGGEELKIDSLSSPLPLKEFVVPTPTHSLLGLRSRIRKKHKPNNRKRGGRVVAYGCLTSSANVLRGFLWVFFEFVDPVFVVNGPCGVVGFFDGVL